MVQSADVVVVGGGPAGATAATLLAEAGHGVLLLEREPFPRFHIGESLLPMALTVLERMGVDLSAGSHQYKAGARFIDESTGQGQTYLFADALHGPPRHAYHVDRADFDAVLLARARQAGTEVHVGHRAEIASLDPEGVRVTAGGISVRARFLVDASGQGALLARRNRTLRPLHRFGRAAAFAHFDGVPDGAWSEIQPDGNIEILRVESGWAWAIPLAGRRLSVGVVAREGKMHAEHVLRTVESSPMLSRWTRGATASEPHLIGDYSYRNDAPCGERYACVGDAACFLDPVFSSGVTLALIGAARMADLLSAALNESAEAVPDLMAPLAATMEPAYHGFYSLIDRFYNTAILDNLFFAEDPDPVYRAGLTTMLAGDVWRSDNPLQDMLLASTRHAAGDGFGPSAA